MKFFKKVSDYQKAQPIDVSQVEPVYDTKGDIKGWHVAVTTCDNRLSSLLVKCGAPVNVPKPRGAKIYSWETDWSKRDQMLVKYFFKDGLFGCGAERASQFRTSMLGQIILNRHK